MPKFIHFGCWNKGGCFLKDDTEETNGLTNVMRTLNDIVANDSYEFISIAGDNYYPKKNKSSDGKTKLFDENELKSGFNCLPEGIPINVIMGNHDYEKNLNVDNKIDGIVKIDGCEILDTEYKLKDEINPNINTKMYEFKRLDNMTKVLMIDTTIYDDKYIKQNIDCYFKHPDLTHLFNREDDLSSKVLKVRNNQKEYIQGNILNLNNGDNLILIGHHPITGFKFKKGKIDENGKKIKPDSIYLIDSPGEPFIDMLYNDIYLHLKSKNINYYYLCADLHQYQIGNISIGPAHQESPLSVNDYMMIKQYIVGTGGADLDPYELPMIEEKQNSLNKLEIIDSNFDVNYLMTEEEVKLSDETYGFLECDSDGSGELVFKFIKTSKEKKTEDIPQNRSIEQLKQLVSQSMPLSESSIQDTIGSFLKGGGKRKTYKKKIFKKKKTIKNKGKSKLKNVKKNNYTKKKKYIKTKRNKNKLIKRS